MTTAERSGRSPGWWKSCPQMTSFWFASILCPVLQQLGYSAQLLSRTQAHRWPWRRWWVGWVSSFYSKLSSWTQTQNICNNFQIGNMFLISLLSHARKYLLWMQISPLLTFDFAISVCRICLCFAHWFVIRPRCREIFECGFVFLRRFDYFHKRHNYFITMPFIFSLSLRNL